MSAHTCHAAGCARRVPPKMFTCRPHWFALPTSIRNAVWREYREGQEDDKRPSVSYMAVQQCAVAYLARRDGRAEDLARAAFNAVAFEAKSREQGLEPLAGLPRVWEAHER